MPIHYTQCNLTTCIIHSITSNVNIIPTVIIKNAKHLIIDKFGSYDDKPDNKKVNNKCDNLACANDSANSLRYDVVLDINDRIY